MKWGLFGGTFDPVHFGHLRAARELVGLLGLDQVIFIPAGLPPHKTKHVITPFAHRLQMLHLAIEGHPCFSLSDVESVREGKSYSIDTVKHFLAFRDANLDLYFITGQDAFDAITTWRDWERLLSCCNFVVMTRPGYQKKGLEYILPADAAARYHYDPSDDAFRLPRGPAIYFRSPAFEDISSSDIRGKIRAGGSIRGLTPEGVIAYIESHGLYQT